MSIANGFITQRFKFDSEKSGQLLTIVYLTSAILAPIIGLLTDKYGKKVKIMLISIVF